MDLLHTSMGPRRCPPKYITHPQWRYLQHMLPHTLTHTDTHTPHTYRDTLILTHHTHSHPLDHTHTSGRKHPCHHWQRTRKERVVRHSSHAGSPRHGYRWLAQLSPLDLSLSLSGGWRRVTPNSAVSCPSSLICGKSTTENSCKIQKVNVDGGSPDTPERRSRREIVP